MRKPRIVIVGEAMLELSGATGPVRLGQPHTLGQGGDTLNTAVCLARLGQPVSYITALGMDPYSQAMIEAWQTEGIDAAHVLRHPDRMPGLYAIRTDARGERSFHYWRDMSAARVMFDLPGAEEAMAAAEAADWLYFSGITLSILPEAGRERLLAVANTVHAGGGHVVFDPNFRPRGWPDPAAARGLFNRLAPDIDLLLPSLDDEDLLFGAAEPAAHMARWRAAGAGTIVAKQGEKGCWVMDAGSAAPVRHAADPAECVVDTTGAGDSFNAGFIAATLAGASPAQAAASACALARMVVGHPGAIPPAEAMAALAASA